MDISCRERNLPSPHTHTFVFVQTCLTLTGSIALLRILWQHNYDVNCGIPCGDCSLAQLLIRVRTLTEQLQTKHSTVCRMDTRTSIVTCCHGDGSSWA
jgi:hypothetical protein